MKHFKRAIFIVSYFFTISTLLFVLVNLVSIWIIEKKLDEKNEFIVKPFEYLNYDAYQQSRLYCSCDSGYLVENISDILDFTKKDYGEYEYYPAIEFNSRIFDSKHINIKAGKYDLNHRICYLDSFRSVKEENLYAVYCFGGSTTFGTFVSDKHTWPAQLYNQLKSKDTDADIIVKNYGTSGYTTTQETEKFLQLLKLGHRPSLAIFMDGVNTGPQFDASEFSRGIEQRFALNPKSRISVKDFLLDLPLVRFLKNQIDLKPSLEGDTDETYPFEKDSTFNKMVVNRFVSNAKLRNQIGLLYGVKVINILQPSTYVKYNYSYLKPAQNELITDEVKRNYRYLYADIKKDSLFIDLSSLFDEYGKPAVIDGLHYSPGFNNFLARSIVPFINFKELNKFKLDTAAATGIAFQN